MAFIWLILYVAHVVAQRLSNMTAASYIDEFNSLYSYDVRVAKFNLMAQSSFGFFRGSNHLWFLDTLASNLRDRFGSAKTLLQGDAHVYNVGSFDSARGNESIIKGDIVYNLNDYDESFYGDPQLDVWRVAVSLILTLRLNGLNDRAREQEITYRYAKVYAESVILLDQNSGPTPPLVRDLSTSDGKLFLFMLGLIPRDRSQMLDLYITKKNEFDFTKRTLSTPSAQEAAAIRAQLDLINVKIAPELCHDTAACSRFLKIKSIARREDTGIGSYGVKRFFVLIEGATADKNKDDYILDIKEQPWPTAFSFLNATDRAEFLRFYNGSTNASRVIDAEAKMGGSIAKILGTIEIAGKPFSVRDRSPWKNTYPALLQDTGFSDVDFSVSEKEKWALGSRNDTHDDMEKMIDQWAQVMAVAHFQGAKNANLPFSSDFRTLLTQGSDTSAGVAAFATLAQTYAEKYAMQVESDFALFRSWGSCVSNVCLWPPLPKEPSTGTNYLLFALIGLGALCVLGVAVSWWYITRSRSTANKDLNGQMLRSEEPIWSGQVVSERPATQFKVPKIDSAEIDEYAQLDEFEGHNRKNTF